MRRLFSWGQYYMEQLRHADPFVVLSISFFIKALDCYDIDDSTRYVDFAFD